MMSLIKQQAHYYLVFFDLKSKIKAEEYQEKTLKCDLKKLQDEVYKINEYINTTKWEIRRAEFILSCEKKRQNFFYNLMKKGEDKISKDDLIPRCSSYGLDLTDYKTLLETEKTALIMQLENLKQ